MKTIMLQISHLMRLVILLIFMSISTLAYGEGITFRDFSTYPDGKILFIRHTLAPGSGDPPNFNLTDCQTQRNLNDRGRQQAVKLGQQIRNEGIVFNTIFSSEWCRCRETAVLMKVGPVLLFNGLNSFYQNFALKEETISRLKDFIRNLPSSAYPVLMVTHFVNINAITGIGVSSGGAVAYDTRTGKSEKVVKINIHAKTE